MVFIASLIISFHHKYYRADIEKMVKPKKTVKFVLGMYKKKI